MPYIELSSVKHRIALGSALAFNVYNADKTLLLAQGQRLDSAAHMQSLMERGSLVNLTELTAVSRGRVQHATREELPALWASTLQSASQVLLHPEEPGFGAALDEVTGPAQALVERDPDLAIFQVLQNSGNADQDYGAQRSLQTAIASLLVAQRLAWSSNELERVFKVALTMNLSMLQLQGELARQLHPLSDGQRLAIRAHPVESRQMLELAGTTDSLWLQAVEQHHEAEDGSGYPHGHSDVGELASLVRRCDIYTAKLAPRASRHAMPADVAARQTYAQEPNNRFTAAMIKEFGIYPPGCLVKLATGAVAVVVARGESVTTPLVSRLTHSDGRPLPAPVRQSTQSHSQRIVGLLPAGHPSPKFSLAQTVLAQAE